jgi:hypothetical protein
VAGGCADSRHYNFAEIDKKSVRVGRTSVLVDLGNHPRDLGVAEPSGWVLDRVGGTTVEGNSRIASKISARKAPPIMPKARPTSANSTSVPLIGGDPSFLSVAMVWRLCTVNRSRTRWARIGSTSTNEFQVVVLQS